MNGKLIIEESLLDEILNDMKELRISNDEMQFIDLSLESRISKVELLLKYYKCGCYSTTLKEKMSEENTHLIYCQGCESYIDQTSDSDMCELCNSKKIVLL